MLLENLWNLVPFAVSCILKQFYTCLRPLLTQEYVGSFFLLKNVFKILYEVRTSNTLKMEV
jgi:hypothetical protein